MLQFYTIKDLIIFHITAGTLRLVSQHALKLICLEAYLELYSS